MLSAFGDPEVRSKPKVDGRALKLVGVWQRIEGDGTSVELPPNGCLGKDHVPGGRSSAIRTKPLMIQTLGPIGVLSPGRSTMT